MTDQTTVDIDAMPAGREMDALVAEKVMGWQKSVSPMVMFNGSTWVDVPRYSTDIAAAWTVVERDLGCLTV